MERWGVLPPDSQATTLDRPPPRTDDRDTVGGEMVRGQVTSGQGQVRSEVRLEVRSGRDRPPPRTDDRDNVGGEMV